MSAGFGPARSREVAQDVQVKDEKGHEGHPGALPRETGEGRRHDHRRRQAVHPNMVIALVILGGFVAHNAVVNVNHKAQAVGVGQDSRQRNEPAIARVVVVLAATIQLIRRWVTGDIAGDYRTEAGCVSNIRWPSLGNGRGTKFFMGDNKTSLGTPLSTSP